MALEPVQIISVSQRRCGLRYGVGACPAAGTPKCFQTFGTCPVKNAFSQTGRITWYFMQSRPGLWFFGDFADPDNISTHPIFTDKLQVSAWSGEINVAGILDGKSAWGVLGGFTVTMSDMVWNDRWGDFYLADRPARGPYSFWEVWTIRNTFYDIIDVVVYDGYVGQSLGEMRKRLGHLEKVDGPDGSGRVTLTCRDPAYSVEASKAKYPRATNLWLQSAIDQDQTSGIIVNYTSLGDITDVFGNNERRYLRIGQEILSYSWYTAAGVGLVQLTGVVRGDLNTQRSSAAAQDRCQRAAHFQELEPWRIAKIIIEASPIPSTLFNFADWEAEAGVWLAGIRSTATIPDAEDMNLNLAALAQQGLFYVWWNPDEQMFRFAALKPPQGAVPVLTDNTTVLKNSVVVTREPESRVTRVLVLFNPRDPTSTESSNYRNVRGKVEADNESAPAGGVIRERIIVARYVNSDAHAYQIISRILSRYREAPEFVLLRVDSKDRELTLGSVTDALIEQIKDTEGIIRRGRWQITRFEEIVHGEIYALKLQSYELLGKYGVWGPPDLPTYLAANDDQKRRYSWWSGPDGKMSNGDEGSKFQ